MIYNNRVKRRTEGQIDHNLLKTTTEIYGTKVERQRKVEQDNGHDDDDNDNDGEQREQEEQQQAYTRRHRPAVAYTDPIFGSVSFTKTLHCVQRTMTM